ncbi:MAG: ABC transporter substrate-binding protein, partial [Acidimicrobiia bacterium]
MLLVVGLLAGACGHRSADSVGQAGAPAEETTGGESTTTVGAAAPETTATSGAAASGDVDVVQRIPGKPGTPGTGGSGTQGGPSSAAGGSGGPATGGESLPGGSSAGVTGDAIKIGGVFPLSGGISALGRPAEQAARAYFRSVNDAGGVGGRRIEFIAEDDGGDPNRTRAAAEKLVEKDGIFVMGPSFTPFSPDLVGFLEGKGVPFIGFDGVNVEGFASSTTVTLGASIAPHARTLVPYWVEKTKTTKIGVVYLDVPPAVSYLNDTRNVICPKLGCEVIEAQPVQFNTTDYTSILLRFRSQAVEGIFIVTDPGSAVKLLLQA